MRRIILLAATAALCASLMTPAIAGAKPPTPTMDATACRVDADTVRVAVSWANLTVTGGEFFINTAPLETGYTSAWNQRGRRGNHTLDFDIGTGIADIVTVNLYNAKDPNDITFEQRVIGEGNDAEELLPC